MQHLLIPTDFSQNSWNATAYALQFFKNQIITFHFLHIDIALSTPSDTEVHMAGISLKSEISEKCYTDMNEWMRKIENTFSNPYHTFKHSIIKTSFIDGLRSFIENNKVEFMVMGTKGASGLKEITVGSKTGAAITRVQCTILVIPENAIFKTPLNLGFPTDFNMLYKNKVIKTLLHVSNMHQSSIKVLRVAQNQKPLDNSQNTNRALLKQRLQDVPHSFHVIENPNLENAVQSFVNTMHIDMVAMIAKNLNFYQRILFKPSVAQISYHIKIPFLVLHE